MSEVTWEDRENHPHMLVQNISGNYFYERSSVGKGRGAFSCDCCGKTIRKGWGRTLLKFYGDDGDYPTLNICKACDSSDSPHKDIISQVEHGDFDTD